MGVLVVDGGRLAGSGGPSSSNDSGPKYKHGGEEKNQRNQIWLFL